MVGKDFIVLGCALSCSSGGIAVGERLGFGNWNCSWTLVGVIWMEAKLPVLSLPNARDG